MHFVRREANRKSQKVVSLVQSGGENKPVPFKLLHNT